MISSAMRDKLPRAATAAAAAAVGMVDAAKQTNQKVEWDSPGTDDRFEFVYECVLVCVCGGGHLRVCARVCVFE